MGTVTRRGLSFVTVSLAAVLALTSVAFACTFFRGQLTITTAAGTSTVVGEPETLVHGLCRVQGGAQAGSGEAITVAVAGYTNSGPNDRCSTSKLPPSYDWYLGVDETINKGIGPYTVKLHLGGIFAKTHGKQTTYRPTVEPCFNPYSGTVVDLGSMVVDANGNGSWSGTLPAALPANGPSDESSICVTASATGSGAAVGSAIGQPIIDDLNPAYRPSYNEDIEAPIYIL